MCLTGYVRTFVVPSVHLSIEAVRQSLHAPLFAVVSNDDGDNFKGQAAPVNDTAIAFARAHVRILDWRVVTGADQFVKLAYCATMVEAHERRKHVAFDWVVRLRPDGLYWPVPSGWLGTLNRTTVYQSSNSGDVMWVMPRPTVATMAAIANTPLWPRRPRAILAAESCPTATLSARASSCVRAPRRRPSRTWGSSQRPNWATGATTR